MDNRTVGCQSLISVTAILLCFTVTTAFSLVFDIYCLIILLKRLYILTDGPAVVSINLFVRNIVTISDIKMVSKRIRSLFAFHDLISK